MTSLLLEDFCAHLVVFWKRITWAFTPVHPPVTQENQKCGVKMGSIRVLLAADQIFKFDINNFIKFNFSELIDRFFSFHQYLIRLLSPRNL